MTAALLVGGLILGAGLGTAHFLSLWWTVGLMRANRTALGIAVQALRFGLLAIALTAVARQSASLFVAAASGLFAARLILTRRYRRLA